eukprot:4640659-Pleurochrysis_carterae.AAC.1
MFECTHDLWGTAVAQAVRALREPQKRFLSNGNRPRGTAVYNASRFPTVRDVFQAPSSSTSRGS